MCESGSYLGRYYGSSHFKTDMALYVALYSALSSLTYGTWFCLANSVWDCTWYSKAGGRYNCFLAINCKSHQFSFSVSIPDTVKFNITLHMSPQLQICCHSSLRKNASWQCAYRLLVRPLLIVAIIASAGTLWYISWTIPHVFTCNCFVCIWCS